MTTTNVIFFLVLTSVVRAETGFLDRSIMIGGDTFRYQIYIPAEYTPAKQWPVAVYLHGDGAQGDDALLQTRSGLAEAIRQQRSRYPIVAVFPQAKTGRKWEHPEMQELVIAELDRTVEEFRGDPSRLYLAGFSMGANGTYRIAYRSPQKFAALVTIAGRIETETSPKYFSQVDIETDRRVNIFTGAPNPFEALASKIGELPIRIFHGDTDMVVPVEQSRRLSTALKKLSANVKYTEYPGVNHPGARDKAFAEPDLIDWLLTQHR